MAEIKADFLIRKEEGLYCTAGDFYLDANKAVPFSIVSHAHADHYSKGCAKILTHPHTVALLHVRHKQLAYEVLEAEYQEKQRFGEVDVTLIPAGHMLGSAMVLMEYQGVKYLYTGDFKLQEDGVCENAEIAKCDVLICDSTFAHEETEHPDVEEEFKKLLELKNSKQVVGVYALGKAQRLLHLLKGCGIPVLVHPQIQKFTEVYEKCGGLSFEYEMYNRRNFKALESCIYLMPFHQLSFFGRRDNFKKWLVTGWLGKKRSDVDVLQISDHVDWPQLTHYIKECACTEIWSVHGRSDRLKLAYGKMVKAL